MTDYQYLLETFGKEATEIIMRSKTVLDWNNDYLNEAKEEITIAWLDNGWVIQCFIPRDGNQATKWSKQYDQDKLFILCIQGEPYPCILLTEDLVHRLKEALGITVDFSKIS